MIGSEHYTEAERLAAEAEALAKPAGSKKPTADDLNRAGILAELAQAHATMAAASATASGTSGVPHDGPTALAWRTAICLPAVVEGPEDSR